MRSTTFSNIYKQW